MKTTFTKEQKKQYFAEKRAKYLEALATFKGKLADNFVCYNAFTGHVYSGNNHCFIAMLGGEAGAYAGFMDWKRHGYSVKKGGHAVSVCQPIVKKHENKDGSNSSEMVNVSYAAVFHFSQVQPIADTAQAELSKPAQLVEVQAAEENTASREPEAVTEETPAAAEVQPEAEAKPMTSKELEACKEVIKNDNPNDWPF